MTDYCYVKKTNLQFMLIYLIKVIMRKIHKNFILPLKVKIRHDIFIRQRKKWNFQLYKLLFSEITYVFDYKKINCIWLRKNNFIWIGLVINITFSHALTKCGKAQPFLVFIFTINSIPTDCWIIFPVWLNKINEIGII